LLLVFPVPPKKRTDARTVNRDRIASADHHGQLGFPSILFLAPRRRDTTPWAVAALPGPCVQRPTACTHAIRTRPLPSRETPAPRLCIAFLNSNFFR
jgi:hypothetical protein